MGLALDIFPPAAWLAAFASLAVVLLGGRLLPPAAHQRFSLPAAMAIGFLLGYCALPRSWAALVPQAGQAWQWLPYLGVVAAAACSLIFRPESGGWIRWWLVPLGLAPLAGFLLAPTWPVFGLSWTVSIAIASMYLLSLCLALGAFVGRLPAGWLTGLLALTALGLAICIAAAISIRLANVGAVAAGALGGCWMSCFVSRMAAPAPAALCIVFSALLGGIAFIACVEPDPPAVVLLVVPALPLVASPFARRTIG